jgi:hypothetical protein
MWNNKHKYPTMHSHYAPYTEDADDGEDDNISGQQIFSFKYKCNVCTVTVGFLIWILCWKYFIVWGIFQVPSLWEFAIFLPSEEWLVLYQKCFIIFLILKQVMTIVIKDGKFWILS